LEVGICQVQSEVFRSKFQIYAYITALAYSVHNSLDVFPQPADKVTISIGTPNRAFCFPGWVPHEGAKQLHYLYVVLLRVFLGQTLEGVDAAQAHR